MKKDTKNSKIAKKMDNFKGVNKINPKIEKNASTAGILVVNHEKTI